MQKVWQFFLDPRVLTALGLAALATFLFLGADALKVGLIWVGVVLAVLALIWLGVWLFKRHQAKQAAKQLEDAMDADAERALQTAAADKKDEVQAVRERMAEAVKLIKTSKLGETSGAAALYELPWYAVIGNPAAGKSSAVVMSGLKFPFADNTDNVIQGIGGSKGRVPSIPLNLPSRMALPNCCSVQLPIPVSSGVKFPAKEIPHGPAAPVRSG